MKIFFIIAFVYIIFSARGNENEDEPNLCIDETLIIPDVVCSMQYDPVCGCDGYTYGNSCEATSMFGVIEYEDGPCN